MVNRLKNILTQSPQLRAQLETQIATNRQSNPDRLINPVQSLDDLYAYASHFLTCLPYQGLKLGEEINLFRRIDQSIGYFYYIFGDLQTHPLIAQWLTEYDTEWGTFLSSPNSWTPQSLLLAQADPLFELNTTRYESPDNWHSWNDFFARRLSPQNDRITEQQDKNLLSPSDGYIITAPVKTATLNNWLDLLGDSPYRNDFKDGKTFHIVLDMYDYHHFHAPTAGTILDLQLINGVHNAGGRIIWDAEQSRYRYETLANTSFQMLEKRGVLILNTTHFGKIALIAVGVAQISSVNWAPHIRTGLNVNQGDHLGYFLCGGSDIVLLFEPNKCPEITPSPNQHLHVGTPLV